MKIAYIGLKDLVGHKFNGMDLCREMRIRGEDARFYVLFKESKEPWIKQICGPIGLFIIKLLHKVEYFIGLQNILSPILLFLISYKHIRECDIIHLQMVQSNYFSILMIKYLAKGRKIFWTLHDPWALTGHCLHPAVTNCDRWRIGCGKCPNLRTQFSIPFDTTKLLHCLKRINFNNDKINIIVASNYMKVMVNESQMFKKGVIHKIAFGIDRRKFYRRKREDSRSKFGINLDSFVIFFRAEKSEFKGLETIRSALRIITGLGITLVTVNEKGLLNEFRNKFKIIDLGWVENDDMLAEIYSASDLFIMPSRAESFGMMAIEAMACGTIVAVSNNTALSETVDYGRAGILIDNGDAARLAMEIEKLKRSSEYAKTFIESASKLVEKRYNLKKHYDAIYKCYQD